MNALSNISRSETLISFQNVTKAFFTSQGEVPVFTCLDLALKREGRICLASDFLDNYINLRQEWPIGPVWNMDEWIAGLRFLKGESDIIIPNHDFEFYQHFPEGIIG